MVQFCFICWRSHCCLRVLYGAGVGGPFTVTLGWKYQAYPHVLNIKCVPGVRKDNGLFYSPSVWTLFILEVGALPMWCALGREMLSFPNFASPSTYIECTYSSCFELAPRNILILDLYVPFRPFHPHHRSVLATRVSAGNSYLWDFAPQK